MTNSFRLLEDNLGEFGQLRREQLHHVSVISISSSLLDDSNSKIVVAQSRKGTKTALKSTRKKVQVNRLETNPEIFNN